MINFIMQMIGNTPIEIIAVICGFINVLLIIKRSIWNYPFGLVMVLLYCKIFYDYQLYSDSVLQIFFFVMQIYGLYNWRQSNKYAGEIVVEKLNHRLISIYAMCTVVGWLIWSLMLDAYTEASYVYWDAAIAALSVTAQILLAKRFIENWYLWITVDVLAIALFAIKGLYPTSALYFVFLIMASIGFFTWRKKLLMESK
ncbi:nicotinamide riboside transporter PnuC [Marinicellulosiphila megalodicopiae]|uniref:nicotinamide riboside transporter PnuC n=1 Tax=Marinicellulosiphila megalodicopiae TaxID=2724896 RepID=UPI003BB1A695